ncbi:hypothetical protein WN55_06052 [Dufourea novaeangliae]|uniref:Uncharacterized protein n=1 Tax=Dufourea novaeangliae TaxID=178035 RepID=A0A154PPD8_DUFNO|nr:hypothetical protein WN55_06052 [Dufourea novaeangliae]
MGGVDCRCVLHSDARSRPYASDARIVELGSTTTTSWLPPLYSTVSATQAYFASIRNSPLRKFTCSVETCVSRSVYRAWASTDEMVYGRVESMPLVIAGKPEFDATEDVSRPESVQQNQEGNNHFPPRFTTEEITFLRSLDRAELPNSEDSTRNAIKQPPIARKRVSWFLPPPMDLLEVPQSSMISAEPDE